MADQVGEAGLFGWMKAESGRFGWTETESGRCELAEVGWKEMPELDWGFESLIKIGVLGDENRCGGEKEEWTPRLEMAVLMVTPEMVTRGLEMEKNKDMSCSCGEKMRERYDVGQRCDQ